MNAALALRVIHCAVPGRVRLHVPPIQRRPRAAERLQAHLLTVEGIHSAQTSVVTGNLLVEFDPACQTLRGVARRIIALLDLPPQLVLAADHYAAAVESPSQLEPNAPSTPAPMRAPLIPTRRPTPLPKDAAPAALPTSVKPSHPEIREIYRRAVSVPALAVLQELGTPNRDGISEAEAVRRAAALGPRSRDLRSRRPAAEILRQQFMSVPTTMLGIAMGVSLFTAGWMDAAVIGAVLLLNGIIGYFTERYAENAIEALQRLGYPQANVIRAGQHRSVPAVELVPGDVIQLRAGDLIPADARLIEGTLLVDEAMLTGESEPVDKHSQPTEVPKHLYEFQNILFQGAAVVDGRARAVVLATGRDTELGRIQALVSGASAPRTKLQAELDRLGKTLGLGAGSVSGFLVGAGILRGQPWLQMLQTGVSLAVSAVPEGLPATATTAFAVGMRRMLRRQVIIRKLPAVEALGSVTVLCVDKTGTLTLNRMTASCYWWEDRLFQCENGPEPCTTRYLQNGKPIDPGAHPALDAMLQVGVLCNDAKLQPENGSLSISGSATEGALLLAACAGGHWFETLRDTYPVRVMWRRSEVHRQRMVSLHQRPEGGLLIAVKGAPESVLELCAYRMDERGSRIPLTAEDRERYQAANERLAAEGLRVLAFAQGERDELADDDATDASTLEEELTWLGMVGLEDPIRPGVGAAIRRCRRAGVRTVILTGDQRGTAMAVARQLGFNDDHAPVLEAADLEQMSASELTRIIEQTAVFARVSPEDKLRIVQALQARGHVVAMTGDGINDGPALKAADIGIAIGQGSSDVAKELADVVLTRNDFESLVAAVEQGRVIFANIRRTLRYLVASNVSELLLAAATLISGIPFPFRPIQILWMNLVSDVFPALALVLEPADRDVMNQPPRSPGTPLISRRDWRNLGGDAGILTGTTLAAYLWAARRYGFGPVANAMAFTSLTTGEAFYALAYSGRSAQPGYGQHGALWGTVAGTVGLQVALNHWGPLRRLLHGAPLGLVDYGVALAAAALPTLWAAARSERLPLPATISDTAASEPTAALAERETATPPCQRHAKMRPG